jgi:predicted phosphodiesterase
MAQYTDFIPENVAPQNVKRIGIYNSNGLRVGAIPLGHLAFPSAGEKLYSFGALSDVHLQYDTAQGDFQRALTYLNETEDVAFTCIAGDLTSSGSDSDLEQYKFYVDTYSADTPVYAEPGNHENYRGTDLPNVIEQYTGHPLYYSFTHSDDVFIMLGIKGDSEGNLFTAEELQWFYETLEANRNKRCFVFFHVFPWGDSGNAHGLYPNDLFSGTQGNVFKSLMAHYKNVVLFHGHSHLKFYLQYGSDIANIDHIFGGWSIHIPSLAVPRDGDPSGASSRKEIYADSEGYVVDVYKNGIHLRGRDFVKGEFLPIASYWLDTTLQTVDAGTYTDSTGTITT